MRHVGSQGGVEALAIFHQLVFDEWTSGTLDTPLGRIKVYDTFLPKHAAVAGWKHRALSFVKQEGVHQMPENHAAEQGDVDGPLAFCIGDGSSWRHDCVFLNVKPLEPSPGSAHTTQQTQEDFKTNNTAGCNVSKAFSLGARKSSPERTIRDLQKQENGSLADHWYLDDGDISCHPILVLPYLQAFDTANAKGGVRAKQTENRSHLPRLRPGRSSS